MSGARDLVRRPVSKGLDESDFLEIVRLRSAKAAGTTRSAMATWSTNADATWSAKANASWAAKANAASPYPHSAIFKPTVPSLVRQAAQASSDHQRRSIGGARGIQACCGELCLRVGRCFGGGRA